MFEPSLLPTLALTACLFGGLTVSAVVSSDLAVASAWPGGRRRRLAVTVLTNRLMAAAWIVAGFLVFGALAGGSMLLVALGCAMRRAAGDLTVADQPERLAKTCLLANASLTAALVVACVAAT